MAVNRQESNLIDLSPPASPSGFSTPASRRSQPQSQSHGYAHSQPQSPPPSHSSGGYGIGSAVLGLWRRFSSLESPSSPPPNTPTPPPSHTQLYHANSEPALPGDGISGPYVPPSRRSVSPLRGLPSLEPLTLHGYRAETRPDARLLGRGLAEEIRTFLPERLKIAEDWKLVYSLYQDGSSLATLYKRCEEYRGKRVGFVLVVRDGREGTFGAYLTEAPHPAPSYFGTGECFLWRASTHAPLPPPPSADTSNLNYRATTIASPTAPSSAFPHDDSQPATQQQQSLAPSPSITTNGQSNSTLSPASAETGGAAAQSVRFQNFAYSGANDYCIFCETGFLSVGGGSGGTFGLWLNDGLTRGHSAPCDTFQNEPLSDEGDRFEVLGVEMWVVGG